jgi:hypothetical protein
MTRSGRYAKLKPGATGVDVCQIHQLPKYPQVVAVLDAEKLRSEAAPGTQQSLAKAQKCVETSGDVWHIYMPTKGRMKFIRRRLRKEGILPPLEA